MVTTLRWSDTAYGKRTKRSVKLFSLTALCKCGQFSCDGSTANTYNRHVTFVRYSGTVL